MASLNIVPTWLGVGIVVNTDLADVWGVPRCAGVGVLRKMREPEERGAVVVEIEGRDVSGLATLVPAV